MDRYHITNHFKWTELLCPCCDRLKMFPGLYSHMDFLEILRLRADFPIRVDSGYRCPAHNKEIGGSDGSWHLLFATDIRATDRSADKLKLLYRIAIDMKGNGLKDAEGEPVWRGIGLYNHHIHLDLRPVEQPVHWTGVST